MSKDILSLKSLYRFLFDYDYPVFSMGIVEKKYHVGLTVTKFWQEKILPEFRGTKSGRIIWRAEGGRNKYTSEILNRSGTRSIYVKYVEELVYIMTQELIFRQIEIFKDFLVNCNYDYKVFMTKMSAYVELLAKEDEMFSADVQDFFQGAMAQRKQVEAQGAVEQAFLCGWLLTFLMLYSFAGNEESYEHLRQLGRNKKLALDNLAATYFEKEYARRKNSRYLTEKNSELCSTPLERRHYFGREEALFDVHEMLCKGGKYLISGIGGAGKTELMRQFLADCENEDLVDYICVIQYEDNLKDSLIKAFARARGKNKEENLAEALATIRIHEGERIVIVVDNVDHSVEEDEGLKVLLELPGTVFLTSRYHELRGFKTYLLEIITQNAGALIFRDNYCLPMENEDRGVLEELLQRDSWRHTLTLKLLGKVAGTKRWSLKELMTHLNKGEDSTSHEGCFLQKEMESIYRHMYAMADLPEGWNGFLRVFAKLPYAGYSVDFAEKYMSTLIADGQSMEEMLEEFWKCGWLDRRAGEYSMHPFIAECFSTEALCWEELQPFVDKIIEEWMQTFEGGPDAYLEELFLEEDIIRNQPLQELTIMVGRMLRNFAEELDDKYVQFLLLAIKMERSWYGADQGSKELVMHLSAREELYSENIRGFISVLNLIEANEEEARLLYDKVRNMTRIQQAVRNIFVVEYLGTIFLYGNFAHIEEVIADNPSQKINMIIRYALYEAEIFLHKGLWEEYYNHLHKVLEFGYEHHMENTSLFGEARHFMINYYIVVGKYQEAEQLWEEQDRCVRGRETLYLRWLNLFNKGQIKLFRGDEGYGIAELEEAKRVGLPIIGVYAEVNGYSIYGPLAIAYNKVGRREEAEECYQKILDFFEPYPEQNAHLHRIYNNMGVMYLDWEKYSEAEEYFQKSYEGGKTIGELPLAEPANNLSKVYRHQGDREKELEYLEMALPILEKYYGSEHPKVIDAKKRKNED